VFDTQRIDVRMDEAPMTLSSKKLTDHETDPLESTDRKLLNLLQWGFPITGRPWRAMGEELGVSEAEVMDRVRRLREAGIVRQTSPIFDTRKLGYTSALIAARVDPARLEQVAQTISRHPGVSHNYRREHELNLWFTLAIPPGADFEAEAKRITDIDGVECVRLLPTLKAFKIGLKLDMERDEQDLERDEPPKPKPTKPARPLTEDDKRLIRATQGDLPLLEAPFVPLAEEAGVSQEELFAWLAEMQSMGYLRRFAAILRHQKAGFTDSGMITWRVPEDRIEEAGRICATFPQVSHCYQRPTYPDWPYNLFTMVHARSRESCERLAEQLAKELKPLGITESAILHTTKEYKKVRVRYFVEDLC